MKTRQTKKIESEQIKRYINNDITRFVESIFRVRDNKGRLIDYKLTAPHKRLLQTGLLGDRSALYRVINKGRQIGFSVYNAIEMITIAQLMPLTNQYYIATKEQQAKSWLKKVEQLSRDARLWIDGSRIIDIDSTKSSQLEKTFKHFPNPARKDIVEKSYIVGLSASPSGIRGDTGIAVLLDEYALMVQKKNQQRDILEAVKYFISQGGQLTMQSTPLVKTDIFWDTYEHAEEKLYTRFYCPVIENWKELDLSKDLRTQKCDIPYPWIDINALEKARRDDLDYFKQENLGIPVDALYRFIDPDLLYPNVKSKEKLYNDGGLYKIAIDVAQKRDLTAITVGEVIEGKIYERHIAESQEKYPVQAKLIKELCEKYKPLELIIDTTGGHGTGLADILEDMVSVPIRRIEFASFIELKDKKMRITEYMATEFKKALIDKTYVLLDNRRAIQHVLRVEKKVTDTGTVRFSGKTSNVGDGTKIGRDDHFWSKAMLNANFDKTLGKNVFSAFGDNKQCPVSMYSKHTPIVSKNSYLMF